MYNVTLNKLFLFAAIFSVNMKNEETPSLHVMIYGGSPRYYKVDTCTVDIRQ